MADRSGSLRVCVAAVAGAHGVRGVLRVKAFTDAPAAIGDYGPLSDEEGGRSFRLTVLGPAPGKRGGDVVLARIDGVEDRDAAEALRGARLFVDRDRLPAPEDDEFYHVDLIGLAVEGADGRRLGTVRAVQDFGAGDLLEIALGRPGEAAGRTVLVPFTRDAVPEVDVAGGRVVVDPPEGLLDAPDPGGTGAGEE